MRSRREREREMGGEGGKEEHTLVCVYLCVYVHTHIYMGTYMHRVTKNETTINHNNVSKNQR